MLRVYKVLSSCRNLSIIYVLINSPTQEDIFEKSHLSRFLQSIPAPSDRPCVDVERYWVSQGEMEPALDPSYILTASVKLNLRDLSRVVSAG